MPWTFFQNNAYFYQGAYQSSVLISAFELQGMFLDISFFKIKNNKMHDNNVLYISWSSYRFQLGHEETTSKWIASLKNVNRQCPYR